MGLLGGLLQKLLSSKNKLNTMTYAEKVFINILQYKWTENGPYFNVRWGDTTGFTTLLSANYLMC